MIDATEDTLYELMDNVQGSLLIDFWAPWCGPCRMVAPVLKQIEAETDLVVFKVNVDENSQLARDFQIMSIPTLVAVNNRDGSTKTIVGAKPKKVLEQELASYLTA